jgi:hypothetical protein
MLVVASWAQFASNANCILDCLAVNVSDTPFCSAQTGVYSSCLSPRGGSPNAADARASLQFNSLAGSAAFVLRTNESLCVMFCFQDALDQRHLFRSHLALISV